MSGIESNLGPTFYNLDNRINSLNNILNKNVQFIRDGNLLNASYLLEDIVQIFQEVNPGDPLISNIAVLSDQIFKLLDKSVPNIDKKKQIQNIQIVWKQIRPDMLKLLALQERYEKEKEPVELANIQDERWGSGEPSPNDSVQIWAKYVNYQMKNYLNELAKFKGNHLPRRFIIPLLSSIHQLLSGPVSLKIKQSLSENIENFAKNQLVEKLFKYRNDPNPKQDHKTMVQDVQQHWDALYQRIINPIDEGGEPEPIDEMEEDQKEGIDMDVQPGAEVEMEEEEPGAALEEPIGKQELPPLETEEPENH